MATLLTIKAIKPGSWMGARRTRCAVSLERGLVASTVGCNTAQFIMVTLMENDRSHCFVQVNDDLSAWLTHSQLALADLMERQKLELLQELRQHIAAVVNKAEGMRKKAQRQSDGDANCIKVLRRNILELEGQTVDLDNQLYLTWDRYEISLRNHAEELRQLKEALQQKQAELLTSNERSAKLRQQLAESKEDAAFLRKHGDTAFALFADLICGEENFESWLHWQAEYLIQKNGPMVRLTELAQNLYKLSPSDLARDIMHDAGGIKKWLLMSPHVFLLHGLQSPGHEQVSLKQAPVRSPTEADVVARQEPGPSDAASTSDTTTSEATIKKIMGEAVKYRPHVSREDKKELDLIIHASDRNPHLRGRNPYVDMPKEELGEIVKELTRETKELRLTRATNE